MAPELPEGERVVLREYRGEDLNSVQRYAGDPEVTRYMIFGPNDRAETVAFLERVWVASRRDPRDQYEVAVVAKDNGELIGGARIGVLSFAHRKGDIGYVLRQDVWGRGIGTEIAGILLHFGFEVLRLHRIEATCDPRNVASGRVLEKVGMQQEGLRRHDFLVRGQWRDSLLFSILESEWRR